MSYGTEPRYIAVSEKVADERRKISQPTEDEASASAEEGELLELTEEDIQTYDPLDVSDINESFFSIRNRDEVAQTVGDPKEIDEELRHLFAVLG